MDPLHGQMRLHLESATQGIFRDLLEGVLLCVLSFQGSSTLISVQSPPKVHVLALQAFQCALHWTIPTQGGTALCDALQLCMALLLLRTLQGQTDK